MTPPTFMLIVVSGTILWSGTTAAQTSVPYTWRNVQIVGGGFIPGIIFNQSEANLVYVRTDIGGAYRLDTVTSRWVPLLDSISWDDWNLSGVVSLATDPVNTNNVYLAAGTYTNEWTSQNGAILRSTDAGATWSRINDAQHQWAFTGAVITGDPRIYGRVSLSTNGHGILYGDGQ